MPATPAEPDGLLAEFARMRRLRLDPLVLVNTATLDLEEPMRVAFLVSLVLGLGAFAASAAPAPEDKDYQKIADKEEWKWVPERASAGSAAKNFKGDFQAEVVEKDTDGRKSAMVKFAKGDDVVFTIEGHAETVFAGRDNIVYYADFSQISSGCSVIAYDLKAKKQIWKTGLKGLGPVAHTRYRNQVMLDIKDDAVHVLGNESFGKYVEYLDLKSGKTVGHKVVEKLGGKEK
jgi:hypothetical protein